MRSIKKAFHNLLRRRNGVASVEMALTVFPYFFVIFMIFEMGRLSITNAYYDLAATEAIRITNASGVKDPVEFKKLFVKNLNDYYGRYISGETMGLFAAELEGYGCVYYAKNFEELHKKLEKTLFTACKEDSYTPEKGKKPIIGYVLKADYKFPVYIPLVQQATNNLFLRHYFMVPEHEETHSPS